MRFRAELRQLREILAGAGFTSAGEKHMAPPPGTPQRRAKSAVHEAAMAVFTDFVLCSCECCWRARPRALSPEGVEIAVDLTKKRLERSQEAA